MIHYINHPWAVMLSWLDGYISKMAYETYKLGKLGQTALVIGL